LLYDLTQLKKKLPLIKENIYDLFNLKEFDYDGNDSDIIPKEIGI
jgi:hypothetical protein